MKFVDTTLLRIGYEEHNPTGQKTCVLLHGWPDSIRTWNGVAPVLAQAGWRVLVPALRGFAPTTFLRADTPRTGQLAAIGRDLIEFIDALQLNAPALVGHDWGARAVANACGLRAGIASHMVMLSVGYGTNDSKQSINLNMARNYWYHWYMNTPRGVETLHQDRRNFARIMWDTWAPPGWYGTAEFEATAAAFDNPDWAEVTRHSYTHRWGHAPGDARYAADDAALTPAPVLDVPTLMLHGEADGVTPVAASAGKEAFFRNRYERVLLAGIGHFPQREAPAKVAELLAQFIAH